MGCTYIQTQENSLIHGFFIGTLFCSMHLICPITHEKYKLKLSWVFQGDYGNSIVIAWIYCPVVFMTYSITELYYIEGYSVGNSVTNS